MFQKPFRLIRDLLTPSPGATPYQAGVMAMAHAVLGAAMVQTLGLGYGLATGLALALVYWLVKERGDLRRGGAIMDGLEDAVMVWLGAWYGAAWWPVMVCCAGLYVMVARGRRSDRV